MIYGSLQAEFMESKYNSHIHSYGTSIFGKFVVNIPKVIKKKITNTFEAVKYK